MSGLVTVSRRVVSRKECPSVDKGRSVQLRLHQCWLGHLLPVDQYHLHRAFSIHCGCRLRFYLSMVPPLIYIPQLVSETEKWTTCRMLPLNTTAVLVLVRDPFRLPIFHLEVFWATTQMNRLWNTGLVRQIRLLNRESTLRMVYMDSHSALYALTNQFPRVVTYRQNPRMSRKWDYFALAEWWSLPWTYQPSVWMFCGFDFNRL